MPVLLEEARRSHLKTLLTLRQAVHRDHRKGVRTSTPQHRNEHVKVGPGGHGNVLCGSSSQAAEQASPRATEESPGCVEKRSSNKKLGRQPHDKRSRIGSGASAPTTAQQREDDSHLHRLHRTRTPLNCFGGRNHLVRDSVINF